MVVFHPSTFRDPYVRNRCHLWVNRRASEFGARDAAALVQSSACAAISQLSDVGVVVTTVLLSPYVTSQFTPVRVWVPWFTTGAAPSLAPAPPPVIVTVSV